MLFKKIIRLAYQLGNRVPGLIKGFQFLLPASIEERITDTILRGEEVSGEGKLVFRDGCYVNGVLGKGLKAGCNLIGFVFGEFGIGEHLRYAARSCLAEGIPFSLVNYDKTLHPQADASLAEYIHSDNPYHTNIFCMNNEGVMNLHASNPEIFKDRYNIGYGFWELSDYPDEWLYAMNFLDEIWAPSRYIQEVTSEKASVPVVYMPMAVDFELPDGVRRKGFGISEGAFVFLFSLDFSSRIQRKNPEGVIRAFREAFPAERGDVVLVIKTKIVESVAQQIADYNLLKEWVGDDSRILLINETFTKEQMLDLIGCCDVYVSLHRAEGFGLGMAEAMKMGKVVVATGYSGNMDFTTRDNACLVDYELKKVPSGSYYMQGDSVWAEPDVGQAAGVMRRLVEDEGFRRGLGARGKAFVDGHHCFERIGERYRERLGLIGLLQQDRGSGFPYCGYLELKGERGKVKGERGKVKAQGSKVKGERARGQMSGMKMREQAFRKLGDRRNLWEFKFYPPL